MIRRYFISGILSIVMLSLVWDFYNGAIMYDPLGDIESAEADSGGRRMAEAKYKSAWGAEIVAKNLFSPLRGTTPPAVIEALPPEPEEAPVIALPELKLNGIIVNQYGEYVAYIRKDRVLLPPLMKGDKYENLQVVDIGPKTVDLVWDEQGIRLSMEKIKKH